MDVDEFLLSPDFVALKKAKKSEFWEMVESLEFKEVKKGTTMAEIQRKMAEHYLMMQIFKEELLEHFPVGKKVAVIQKWPRDKWVVLLQSVLKRKAQRAYAALSMEVAEDYEEAKLAILRAYELVPEAYRQEFRDLRKQWNQTFTEVTYDKCVYFDRWCAAEGVGEDFCCLRKMILIEELKDCVPDNVRRYPNEKKNKSISESAKLADEYALTHQMKFSPNKCYYGAVGVVEKAYRLSLRLSRGLPEKTRRKSRLAGLLALCVITVGNLAT
ncbi:uncharacterized protein LOC132387591 [Hypanus sabinus]|uniref:uncharacterized protein LOC132387591 n=1 Tax=Hypanus sabinus TaxID=79690 RepID=UPI0028C46C1B|nr:uncharacterized protein LOC132387591 [Hypanus sabinus]